MTPKKLYLGLFALGLGLLLTLFAIFGTENIWRLWNIDLLQPPFLDFLLIPGSAASLRAGFNPALNNPFDPVHRIFNYPQIWYLILRSPIDFTWAAPVSLTCIALFFLSLLAFPGKLEHFSVFMLLLIGFSSAVMLGVERANVDLIFFSSLTLALILSEWSGPGSWGLLLVSVIFKVYPIFGVGYWLQYEKKRALKYIFSAAAVSCLYFLITFQDMSHVFSTTMKGDDLSYGWAVAPLFMERQLGWTHPIIRPIFLLGVLALLARAVFLGVSQRPATVKITSDQRNLNAFWLGAGIYLGTFLLGNNWDYRLMFLLFTIPQLAEWARKKTGAFRRAAQLALITLTISCWYSVIWMLLSALTIYGHSLGYLIDEYANWVLFAQLAYLLVYSLPDWVFSDWVNPLLKLVFKKDYGQVKLNNSSGPVLSSDLAQTGRKTFSK